MTDPQRIAFAGDWHSNTAYAIRAIRHAKTLGADAVVHCGDFGYQFPHTFVGPVNDELADLELDLWFVDGNHDNPNKLTGPTRPNGLRPIADHIWHIPRGHRWTWSGVTFLGCGGAVSVDRPWRTPGKSWWPEEAITDTDVQRCIDGGAADVFVTHDCPSGVVIPGIDDRPGPPPFPPLEIQRSNEHRRVVRRIADAVRPALIMHGHYHVAYDTEGHALGYPARVFGLDCDGGDLDRNIQIIDLDRLLAGARG